MDDDHKISVVINTYNAERLLTEVLEAAIGFDEIVVCDMESTDRTLEIAERYGCKIVTFPKEEHKSAEPARTFAIQSASCKWVLVVDADEIITPALRDYLYHIIASPDCPQGLYIPRMNMFMGKYMKSTYPDYQLRFFIREGTEWPPFVHTFPIVKGRCEKIPKRMKDTALRHLADDTLYTISYKDNEYTDNEVDKKSSKGYGVGALIYRPIWRFMKYYILEGGFLDGQRGLIKAFMKGHYQFLLVAKIIEKRKRKELADEVKEGR